MAACKPCVNYLNTPVRRELAEWIKKKKKDPTNCMPFPRN